MAKVDLQPFWEFFKAKRWSDAEQFLRRQIEACDPNDTDLLVHLRQLLGGILAKLGRPSDATAASRAAVKAAVAGGQPANTVAVARYTLALQLLESGDPAAALREAEGALSSYEPIRFHFHAVCAEALSQLGRHADARAAALAAVTAAPNEVEREHTRRQLAQILRSDDAG